ncbi:MAG: 50S ribosomal protein L1 [Bifidobacterium sp.]|jgi:large subunit ribosomal protein L1|nr:50S ribosomal protein L1 [Bifidobacterium sp.]
MAKHSKKYREASEKVDRNNLYTASEAISLIKSMPKRGFDETVEAVYCLNVDPRKADQLVRGVANLPHGTGKTATVLVFARGPKATEASEAGADIVGDDDLIEKVQGGFLDFDAVVATPDMMGKVGRLGRVLGPRGLMPNPKTGTVTMDVTKAVSDIKGGKIEFRVDKNGNLSFIVGKTSFDEDALEENFKVVADEIKRLKPSTLKGRYITKATISSTMGPGIPLDVAPLA